MADVILKHVPGMKRAAGVPVHRAEELSESVFMADYVANSAPCVIRGAVKHWPAVQKWRDSDYLKRKAGHHAVSFFASEYHARWERLAPGKRDTSLAEAIDALTAPQTRMGIVVTSLPRELLADLGGLGFLTRAEPAFAYDAARYFFYRNAGTSWHFHSFDETLMSQILGSKKIGLLKTNTQFYQETLRIFCEEKYYDDPAAFDGFDDSGLDWRFAELEAGDALYIPPLWWHGVIPTHQTFGATTAVTWRSPPHVIANSIRQMAAGEVDVIGQNDLIRLPALAEAARKLGVERELAIAWERRL